MSAYVNRQSLDNAPDALLSSRNVGRLTTFDLRQELVRRDKLDIPEDEICHKTLLQRLMRDLLEEEQQIVDDRAAVVAAEQMCKLNAAKAERERKKQEALERSKQRTQNSNYFATITDMNKLPAVKDLTTLEELSSTDKSQTEDMPDSDPFRALKVSRSRIHIK